MRFWGMLRFTISEAVRKGTLIFYAAIATLIMVFFAIGISRPGDTPGMVTFFGMPMPSPPGQQFDVVQFIIVTLHRQSVFWIVVFGVFGTAGLIPSLLEKGTAELFLSKPLSRLHLMLARAAGAVGGIALNIVYFTAGIWLVFGLKLGVWHAGLLLSSLALAYTFWCYFSVVTFVALITRSTGFTVMLALSYTIISWGLELRERGLYVLWDNVVYQRVLDGLYYLLPQLNAMLSNSSLIVGTIPFTHETAKFTIMPFVYSLGSSVLLYAGSIWYFSRQDY